MLRSFIPRPRRFIIPLLLGASLLSCTPKQSITVLPVHTEETDKGAEATEDAAASPHHDMTFAIVFPLMHSFFTETNRGALEKAEELYVNVIQIGPQHFNVNEQIASMEKLIEAEVDGIGIGAFDPEALTPVINKAIDKGIPVISFDTDAPGSKRLSFISTDNLEQGRHLGRLTAEALNGKGKVIISQGVPTQLNLNQRLEGVREILDGYPEIEIAAVSPGYGNQEKTIASIESMADAHPDFDALVGLDAEAGPSAVIVWRSRGYDKKLIVSEDMPAILKGIRDGIVSATIVQEQYAWGALIVQRLYDANKGKTLEEFEMTSTRVIDADNIDEHYPD